MATAITQARHARGTSDAGNDWLLDTSVCHEPAEKRARHGPPVDRPSQKTADPAHRLLLDPVSSVPLSSTSPSLTSSSGHHLIPPVPAASTLTTASSSSGDAPVSTRLPQSELSSKRDAAFTVTVADPLTNDLEAYLDKKDVDQLSAEAGDEEGLNKLLDQSLWESFLRTAKETLHKNRVKTAALMGYGTTFNTTFRGENIYGRSQDTPSNKTQVRIETCIAMRLLQLITLFLGSSIPWLLLVPHFDGDDPYQLAGLPRL